MKLGLFKRFKLGKGWIYFVIQIKTIQMQNWTFILNKCQNCWNPKHFFFKQNCQILTCRESLWKIWPKKGTLKRILYNYLIFSFSALRIKILQVKKNLILTAYSFENIPSFIKWFKKTIEDD